MHSSSAAEQSIRFTPFTHSLAWIVPRAYCHHHLSRTHKGSRRYPRICADLVRRWLSTRIDSCDFKKSYPWRHGGRLTLSSATGVADDHLRRIDNKQCTCAGLEGLLNRSNRETLTVAWRHLGNSRSNTFQRLTKKKKQAITIIQVFVIPKAKLTAFASAQINNKHMRNQFLERKSRSQTSRPCVVYYILTHMRARERPPERVKTEKICRRTSRRQLAGHIHNTVLPRRAASPYAAHRVAACFDWGGGGKTHRDPFCNNSSRLMDMCIAIKHWYIMFSIIQKGKL